MSVYMQQSDKELYKGCVLRTWEHNGAWDSDFYAEVWDEENQCVKTIEYGTTRFPDMGIAEMDATTDVVRKAYRFYKKNAAKHFDSFQNEHQAKDIAKGDRIVITRGRKVKKGTEGEVFWVGQVLNRYSYQTEDRIGIKVDGETFFVPKDYAEVIDWKKKLITGKRRKEIIRKEALRCLPYGVVR